MEQSGEGRAGNAPSADFGATPSSTATDERADQPHGASGTIVDENYPPGTAGSPPRGIGVRASGLDAAPGSVGEARRRRRRAVRPGAHPATSRAKRALDVTMTLVCLPVIGVVCLIIATLVAATSRGPVFFVQERVGLGGRSFRMVKFRTMLVDAEERLRQDPTLWDDYVRNDYKLPNGRDPRVTAVGRFLRRSSLDELPQLINVLRGQMSLVGPRPIVPEEVEKYGTDPEAYTTVRPGITGWWQVNGRSGVGYPERVDLDREYAASWTFWLDVQILLRTPLTVLRARGAH
jgi:lipopolysaccharide/colanic/teichoic acid biosynthesis glycosyltransferase